ncbi:MAG: SRPBCC domain-containing protein [Micrococcales bacterium]|nr:SRPBCC domain-containing protein [Micrococcales bacterium]
MTRHTHEPNTNDAIMLELERAFDAPREALYRAFADGEMLAKWFGPKGFHVDPASVDVRAVVGGPQRFTMVADDDPSFVSPVNAIFTEVVEGERLVGEERVTGEGDGEPPMDLTLALRLDFADGPDGGSRLRLTQGPFPAMVAEQARGGWESSFAKLDELLRG